MKHLKAGLIALTAVFSFGAVAAFAYTSAVMPVFYTQGGSPVNTGSGYLASGYYYLNGGLSAGGHQIEYYGNGVYYDPSVMLYGGSVNDPQGTAGVSLGYSTAVMAPSGGGYVMAMMPTLYSQNSSTAVNTGNGYLGAGFYNLGNTNLSGAHQIYYFGNGVYYDPTTMLYGGSVTNPNGTSGVSLGYSV